MVSDLIFDVGMNNGDDTAYYLFKGFRVVAIEADPTLVEQARERFAEPIRQGRLEIVNVAIGPRDETASFWICDQKSEWNSFDYRIASRDGLPCHAIDVQCRPFRDLLKQYGVPYYLKIDIEGHDTYCVADLDPHDLPKYLSLEMASVDCLWSLRDLGYKSYKLITQNDHSQLSADPFTFKSFVKRQLLPYPGLYHFSLSILRVGGVHRPPFASARTNHHGSEPNGSSWKFSMGSSGPFGEDTNGPWRTLEETAYTWITFQLGRSVYGTPSLSIWHDVHARSVETT